MTATLVPADVQFKDVWLTATHKRVVKLRSSPLPLIIPQWRLPSSPDLVEPWIGGYTRARGRTDLYHRGDAHL